MNVALYARVSSEKQAEKDLSIAAQLKALRNFAKKKNWQVVREFVDEAESARTDKRPAFQEMIAFARKRSKPFEAILIWKHSRFARNREDAIIYKSLLRRHGISVISINEQVDDTPAGKLLEGIIEVIDEFYSLNLAQDTLRGLKENAARGFHNGSIPIGYKARHVMDGATKRTKLELDDDYGPVVKRVFQMYLDNNGIKEIAKTLNTESLKTPKGKPWSKSTVGYILKNEAYTGTLVYNRKSKNRITENNPEDMVRVNDNHTPIVDRITFESVQKMMKSRSPKITPPRQNSSRYLLSGLVYCGKCGAKMVGSSAKSGTFFYYGCQNYLKRGKNVCDMKLANRNEIERLVIGRIKTHVLTEDNLAALWRIVLEEISQKNKDVHQRVKTIDRQIGTLNQRLSKLYDALETGKLDIDDLAPRIKSLKTQIDEMQNKKEEIIRAKTEQTRPPFNQSALKYYVDDLADLLKKGSIVEQKAFLKSFIKRINVNHPKVDIEYTIPSIQRKKAETPMDGVLPFGLSGSPARTRTADPVVNSHLLCQLSYWGISHKK
ncbi:Serine recombinase [Candidatus Desulfarcum epimagneticum]|uniref:Serine recombinase n=1 Tax=uncultured Desulfobacteraceae bacterium TaxID=218296 RepID=A0A484HHU9_9BACT|nr:Serine recombinase [uncultured Desulfobacteraceae bacterium]